MAGGTNKPAPWTEMDSIPAKFNADQGESARRISGGVGLANGDTETLSADRIAGRMLNARLQR